MKNLSWLLLLVFMTSNFYAQENPKPNYRAAAKYSPKNLAKLANKNNLNVNILDRSSLILKAKQNHTRLVNVAFIQMK